MPRQHILRVFCPKRRYFKRILVFVLILFAIVCFKNLLKEETNLSPFPTSNKPSETSMLVEPILILLTKFGGKKDMWEWENANSVCSKQCIFTNNMSHWNSSSVVIFHGNNHIFLFQDFVRPSSSQVWVWMNLEPAAFYSVEYATLNRLKFNWTMSYRHDADIVVPYRRIYHRGRVPTEMQNIQNFMLKSDGHDVPKELPSLDGFRERKMAAWIVSHCNTTSKREILVAELQKQIDVDIFGSCGNKQCSDRDPYNILKHSENCRFEIQKKYKFYLAFENALCTDYVTEKMFETLYFDMVPIVYGSANYKKQFPKNSFINVQDFKSITALIAHVKVVANSPQKWLKYFAWRKEYTIIDSNFLPAYCDICNAAVAKPGSPNFIQPKSYRDIGKWWVYNPKTGLPNCKTKQEALQFLETFFKKQLINSLSFRTKNRMHRFV